MASVEGFSFEALRYLDFAVCKGVTRNLTSTRVERREGYERNVNLKLHIGAVRDDAADVVIPCRTEPLSDEQRAPTCKKARALQITLLSSSLQYSSSPVVTSLLSSSLMCGALHLIHATLSFKHLRRGCCDFQPHSIFPQPLIERDSSVH